MVEKLTWVVESVTTDKLQEVLNKFEHEGYDVDKYEHVAEHFEGLWWVVVGKLRVPKRTRDAKKV